MELRDREQRENLKAWAERQVADGIDLPLLPGVTLKQGKRFEVADEEAVLRGLLSGAIPRKAFSVSLKDADGDWPGVEERPDVTVVVTG